MALHKSSRISFLTIVFFFFFFLLQSPVFAAKKSYVVYLGAHSHATPEEALLKEKNVVESHHALLRSVLRSKEMAKDAIFHSYTKHINGFAAMLDDEEAAELAKHASVVSVFPDRAKRLHTTRSWSFLGLEKEDRVPEDSLWIKARFGEDTIIGNLDTGVWPESESFKDGGMGPVPSRWRGICDPGKGENPVKCNKKLIGARYFPDGYLKQGKIKPSMLNPRDFDGHGTHTLSTAGGAFVPNASILGFKDGTAKGGSPRARVAAYKVCWEQGCYDSDVVAGYDAAIHDGVDVLSVSIGQETDDYFDDGNAIGAFHAVQNGILVVCSAGNRGPFPGSVSNSAPWVLTVGASTIKREFPAYALFNNQSLKGLSLSRRALSDKKYYPMIRSEDAVSDGGTRCSMNSLDSDKVRGKIVVCPIDDYNLQVENGLAVDMAGGAGMILVNDEFSGDQLYAHLHFLPATQISYSDGVKLYSYLASTKSPMGYITPPKTMMDKLAPLMADFSSLGPNLISQEILKPDITAPGVEIIAAYSPVASPTGSIFDNRSTDYNLLTGTSMACPHISGVVGLLKTLQRSWSPAMIRSAIMTTAGVGDNSRKPLLSSSFLDATPFSYGAGNVRPNLAMDPGLVYNIAAEDYLNFLCASGHDSTKVSKLNSTFKCPTNPPKPEDLNYPSIAVPNLSGSVTVKRTVTNVGNPGIYKVTTHAPSGISVIVRPATLEFQQFGEEKKFEVTLEAKKGEEPKDYVFGAIVWSDGKHNVRSPLAVKGKA